jgi:hypothetical protein
MPKFSKSIQGLGTAAALVVLSQSISFARPKSYSPLIGYVDQHAALIGLCSVAVLAMAIHSVNLAERLERLERTLGSAQVEEDTALRAGSRRNLIALVAFVVMAVWILFIYLTAR